MIGKRLAHYEILDKVGAGGMGEVYRARDTHLDREVAIKILPEAFNTDAERLARFEREAKLLASLNHPGIATIHGLHQEEGTRFLAMELVPGENLAQRLEAGSVTLEDAIHIARQVAEAVEAAHEQGVIHRDLKPANIVVTDDGKTKVLDFGLAKSMEVANSGQDLSASPTLAAVGTMQGVIMGTAAYMSPEQARGKPVDKRSDIWSYGVVLYEMLTRRRLFSGETVSDTIAGVLKTDIDFDELPKETPRALMALVRRCLERDPSLRLRDIGEARIVLAGVQSGELEDSGSDKVLVTSHGPAGGQRSWLAVLGGIAAGILSTILAFNALAPETAPPRAVISNLLPPDQASYNYESFLELSPDGKHLAFVANSADGEQLLWIRDLGAEKARPLSGTTGAVRPFWSPDSRFIAYFADRKLRKIGVDGGVPVVIAVAGGDPRGGAWGEDGTILFVPDWTDPVFRIAATGEGKPMPVTQLDPDRLELSHRWPHFLPDGKHFLFYAVSTYPAMNPENPSEVDKSGLYLGSFDGEKPKLITTARSRATYVDGSLLLVDDGIFMAQPFDLATMSLTGQPAPLAEGVTQSVASLWGGALFSVSQDGKLIFVHGASERRELSQFVWRDRSGKKVGTFGEQAAYENLRISHDGLSVVTSSEDPGDLWVFDLEAGSSRRFTFDSGDDVSALWSPDDTRILFVSSRVIPGEKFTPATIFSRSSSGQEEEIRMISLERPAQPIDWSPDGRLVLLDGSLPGKGYNILVYSLEDGTVEPFLETEHNEQGARFSHDGKWVAYESDESGRLEIYVQAFPGPAGKWQVSRNGGRAPCWRADSGELFFVDLDANLFAVPISLEGGFMPGTPSRLFDSKVLFQSDSIYPYDVSPDGQRFLILEPVEESPDARATVTLIQNWTELIDK